MKSLPILGIHLLPSEASAEIKTCEEEEHHIRLWVIVISTMNKNVFFFSHV